MSLTNFLNPEGEDDNIIEGELPADPLEALIEIYQDTNQVIDLSLLDEEEEFVTPQPRIHAQDALRGLQLALQFQLRQDDASAVEIRTLQRLERTLQLKAQPEAQSTLASWLIR